MKVYVVSYEDLNSFTSGTLGAYLTPAKGVARAKRFMNKLGKKYEMLEFQKKAKAYILTDLKGDITVVVECFKVVK